MGIGKAIAVGAAVMLLGGCGHLERTYHSADNAALKGPPTPLADTTCEASPAAAPEYDLAHLKDCTAPDTFVVFAFSGGGIRSAAFGYGALQAAHGVTIGEHKLTQDIDVVTGVSGGSFTAAAFASHREKLFPAPGAADYYRDHFLTHDFFADLLSIYLAPWHWQWMLPYYTAQDELAKIYGDIPFSSPDDTVFARTYGDLARQGRPLLVVQATDYGNEQPFTFTQPDFDLICSDLRTYPVGNAVAASSAFPVLFSPIRLTNHHHTDSTDFCATHRPEWVDRVLNAPEPEDLSRLYSRARVANDYLPPKSDAPQPDTLKPADPPRSVFLQDGGVVDNVALRGFANSALPYVGENNTWPADVRAALCRGGWNRIKHIVVVVVDGEAQPSNKVATLPYLSDLLLVLNVTSSAMIDANGFETMLATDALTKQMAKQFMTLDCPGAPAPQPVTAWFARVSFQDLAETTTLPPAACKRDDNCTVGDLARSETSLAFTGPQVDALIAAGRSAFQCNMKLQAFLRATGSAAAVDPALACRKRAGPN
jgi:NTE family protein